jgi:hypothetical protein
MQHAGEIVKFVKEDNTATFEVLTIGLAEVQACFSKPSNTRFSCEIRYAVCCSAKQ